MTFSLPYLPLVCCFILAFSVIIALYNEISMYCTLLSEFLYAVGETPPLQTFCVTESMLSVKKRMLSVALRFNCISGDMV